MYTLMIRTICATENSEDEQRPSSLTIARRIGVVGRLWIRHQGQCQTSGTAPDKCVKSLHSPENAASSWMPIDVEETWQTAHLGVQGVERLIGRVQGTSEATPVSMEAVLPCEGHGRTFLDKMVSVCLA